MRPTAHALTLIIACFVTAALGLRHPTALAQRLSARVTPVLALEDLSHITDVDGNLPTEPNTPLYGALPEPDMPIIAPDGRHVTLAEWMTVDGTAHIERQPDGTEVSLELTGLIPDGVYTLWAAYFTDPPFNYETPNFPHNPGLGVLGGGDGSLSVLEVDEHGAATYVATHPAGPLSVRGGDAPLWALEEASDFVVLGIYHLDGQLHGALPGPHAGAFVAGFSAIPEPSSVALSLVGTVGVAGVAFARGWAAKRKGQA